MTNNPEQEEKPIAVIRWSTTSKISEYDARELPAIRKSACSRTGFITIPTETHGKNLLQLPSYRLSEKEEHNKAK